jgi:hypothetical protein
VPLSINEFHRKLFIEQQQIQNHINQIPISVLPLGNSIDRMLQHKTYAKALEKKYLFYTQQHIGAELENESNMLCFLSSSSVFV